MGYNSWDCKESDTTERLTHTRYRQSCRQYTFSIVIAQTRSGVRQLEWRGWLQFLSLKSVFRSPPACAPHHGSCLLQKWNRGCFLAGVVEDVWEAEAEPEELYIIFSCNIFF